MFASHAQYPARRDEEVYLCARQTRHQQSPKRRNDCLGVVEHHQQVWTLRKRAANAFGRGLYGGACEVNAEGRSDGRDDRVFIRCIGELDKHGSTGVLVGEVYGQARLANAS